MKITNKTDLPEELVWLAENQHEIVDNKYSVTTLLDESRKVLLFHRHTDEVKRDVTDMIWALFGTAFHKIVAEPPHDKVNPLVLREHYMEHELLKGYKVTGTTDYIDTEKKHIYDWKTASVFKVTKQDFDKDIQQVLYYATLYYLETGIVLEQGSVVYLLKDHHAGESWKNNYPKDPVYVIDFAIDLGTLKETEIIMKSQLSKMVLLEDIPDEDLPPCEDTWGGRRCVNYCQSRDFCDVGRRKYLEFIEKEATKNGKK